MIAEINWSNVVESAIGSFIFWLVLALLSLLFQPVRNKARAFWPEIFLIFSATGLTYVSYKQSGSTWSAALVVGLLLFVFLLTWWALTRGIGLFWSKFTFRQVPFALLVGNWHLTFGRPNNQGDEIAVIDRSGRYFINGQLRFRLKNLNFDMESNELSWDKVEPSGRLHHREVVRMANSASIFIGHKERDQSHLIRYSKEPRGE